MKAKLNQVFLKLFQLVYQPGTLKIDKALKYRFEISN